MAKLNRQEHIRDGSHRGENIMHHALTRLLPLAMALFLSPLAVTSLAHAADDFVIFGGSGGGGGANHALSPTETGGSNGPNGVSGAGWRDW
jgi:hypothetical protein